MFGIINHLTKLDVVTGVLARGYNVQKKIKIIMGAIGGFLAVIAGFIARGVISRGFKRNDSGGAGVDSSDLRQSVDTSANGAKTEQAKLAELTDAIASGTDCARLASGDVDDALATARKIRDTAKKRQDKQ